MVCWRFGGTGRNTDGIPGAWFRGSEKLLSILECSIRQKRDMSRKEPRAYQNSQSHSLIPHMSLVGAACFYSVTRNILQLLVDKAFGEFCERIAVGNLLGWSGHSSVIDPAYPFSLSRRIIVSCRVYFVVVLTSHVNVAIHDSSVVENSQSSHEILFPRKMAAQAQRQCS